MANLVAAGWFIAWIGLVFWVSLSYPQRYCRGIISRKWQKVIFRNRNVDKWGEHFQRLTTRMSQLLAWGMVAAALHYGPAKWDVPDAIYWPVAAIPYIDDVLTGDDDDRWKRRWQAVKNKLKWRMVLPAPVPVRVNA